MSAALDTIQKIIANMELNDCRVVCDEQNRKISVFINDENLPFLKDNLPALVQHFNLIAQLVAKKQNEPPLFVDLNNYRLERERIILELAKAAARKVIATKEAISLPAMNAYERRLIHTALATHPEVTTESIGVGKERYVVVKIVA